MSVLDGVRSPLNPAASRDNLWTEDLPQLVPCCEGQELQMGECLGSGLSMISVREAARVLACCSDTAPPTLKHRNSFRSLHRPELRRVPGLRHLSPAALRLVLLQVASNGCVEAGSEMRASSARALPAGMRLRRAQLFTAVLAADRAGPGDRVSTDDTRLQADDLIQDDESLANEEVQIILRPKIDEEVADCSTK